MAKNLAHYNETLNSFTAFFDTNIPKNVFLSMIREILLNGKKWETTSVSLTGNYGIDKVHLTNLTTEVIYPNETSLKEVKALMKQILE